MKDAGNNTYLLDPVTIAMVGMRGVGKTSLLASMYSQLQSLGAGFAPSLDDDEGRTDEIMQRYIVDLTRFATGRELRPVETGIVGTMDKSTYRFAATTTRNGRFREKRFTIPVDFVDFPGGWFKEEKHAEVDDVLQSSWVSFVAIDAPAMMSEPFLHKKFNDPEGIKRVYERNAPSMFSHTVVLTLIRAEKYIQEGKREELYAAVQEQYGDWARTLERHGICVFATYVETVGGVVFASFEELPDKSHKANYIRTRAGYQPRNCQIPLQLALFRGIDSLADRIAEKIENDGAWDKIWKFFFGDIDALAKEACHNVRDAIVQRKPISGADYIEI